MPLIKYDIQNFPDTAEVSFYEIHSIDGDEIIEMNKRAVKELIFVCKGIIDVQNESSTKPYCENDILELTDKYKSFSIKNADEGKKSTLIRIGGCWGEQIGNYGVFILDSSSSPRNDGDPVNYVRNTRLDNHFHDCDEYWIIWRGSGTAVSEGKSFDVSPGDCIYTKMGEHHDLPIVDETIHGVYFETTLKGKKRLGHLWNHTHKR